MTLEERVGQVLLVGVHGKSVLQSSDAARLVGQIRVGGVILLGRNVRDPMQLARFSRDLQELAPRVPLFVALDQEGGVVVRLRRGATVLPGNMALGATRSPSLAYMAGKVTAAELSAVGVNMNLAPVLDVNSNPQNPVIGVRAYGDDAALVSELGTWYIRGLQELGVVAVAKHFPGHGETEEDSHHALPAVPHDRRTLTDVDLPPFRAAMKSANLDAVMTAHVRYTGFEGPSAPPATMSHSLLTDLLRGELGFQGLVVTDDLEMAAIDDTVGIGPAAVRAVAAGADLVMVIWRKTSKEEAFQAILEAVQSGELPEARLNEAVRRVLTVKARRGILTAPLPDPERANKIVGHPHHRAIAAEIARRAVTVVGSRELAPVGRNQPVMVIGPRDGMARLLRRTNRKTFLLETGNKPSPGRRKGYIRSALRYQNRVKQYVVVVDKPEHGRIAAALAKATTRPVIAISLGSPYHLEPDEVDHYICAYSSRPESMIAAVRILYGQADALGVSPVALGQSPDASDAKVATTTGGGESASPPVSNKRKD
jgi:beta-N-acetylhexosaminidase